jgi:hypothetical protein
MLEFVSSWHSHPGMVTVARVASLSLLTLQRQLRTLSIIIPVMPKLGSLLITVARMLEDLAAFVFPLCDRRPPMAASPKHVCR